MIGVDIPGIIGAVTGIGGLATGSAALRYACRSASADQRSAEADHGQLAIEQVRRQEEEDRRREELEQRGDPALEGHVVRSPDDDGTGRARLEIRVTNAVELLSIVVIFRAGCPVNPVAPARVMMENRRPFPDIGNTVIRTGHPAHWRVHVVGDLEPFTVDVMARGDYGARWERIPVRVAFDGWAPPAPHRRSLPVRVRHSIGGRIRRPLSGRARQAIGAGRSQ
jgi:hypothetical protein